MPGRRSSGALPALLLAAALPFLAAVVWCLSVLLAALAGDPADRGPDAAAEAAVRGAAAGPPGGGRSTAGAAAIR